jgi:hypothetical protein
MPAQTSQTNIYFPDGCQVLIKASGDADYTDLGVIEGDTTATFNFDVNQVETANAGKTVKQYKNMTVEGGFTLNSLNPTALEKLGTGLFSVSTTAASPVATIPDQVIAAGWADNTAYDLVMYTSSSDTTLLRTTAKPTLTSVTLDAGGTPEALTENDDYVIIASDCTSGWAIVFISAGIVTGSPTTKDITINYDTNTPVATVVMSAGTSTQVSTPCEMMYKHTDSDSLVRSFYMPSCEPNSGGFQFNFKGANSDGLESMPITFTARLDTTKTDGEQLFQWTIENGAA